MGIEVRNVSKTFGSYKALDRVSLHIQDGELITLLGPSGSGKTTLLRIIAGLEFADEGGEGEILFQGKSVTDDKVRDRNVGFVFQHYALFKHMSVFENIAFGLRVRPASSRPSKQEIRDRVNSLLKLIQLENFGNRYPSQLSGGQRQRVALARALAIEPRVLLLDEPFGALDAKVRQGLRNWLRQLHEKLKMTTVLVTHDQEEALEVADRVVVMNQAKIAQVGTPTEVFHHPASEFVMDFLGNVNVFRGRIEAGQAVLGGVSVALAGSAPHEASSASVYVRPHELSIERSSTNNLGIPAKILRIHPAGSISKVFLQSSDQKEVQVDMPFDQLQGLSLKVGETVFVSPKRVRVFLPEFEI